MVRVIWSIVGISAAIAGLAILSLALPVKTWSTGREPVVPLRLTAGGPKIGPAARLWIDTDAACGASGRADPDDCFAIALLLKSRGERIVGVSTVFGNASLETTDRTARQLVRQLAAEGMRTTNVYAGAAAPFDPARPVDDTPARKALQKALREGPLVIVALGPLSNVAAALHNRPDLQRNVTALVAVMGRRPGHVFHPTEGASGAMLWGHGPIFRDFNFVQDEYAAARIVATQLPLILIPYDAARDIMIGEVELAALSAAGGAWQWIADRARDWLAYWKKDIGQAGFYPFDLAAAAYVVQSQAFECAETDASVTEEKHFWSWLLGSRALLVGPDPTSGDDADPTARAVYCPRAKSELKRLLLATMTAPDE